MMVDDFIKCFEQRFGVEPTIFRAPGRVNLIGEHTDYNDGFVLPAALRFETWAGVAPRSDQLLRVWSNNRGEERLYNLNEGDIPRNDWGSYVAGVALILKESGVILRGADMMVDTTVPLGAGLSSSAALEVSAALGLLHIAGQSLPAIDIARRCQRAENEVVGMRCGIMDQYISACGVAGHALQIDCRSLTSLAVPLPETATILIANSMVHHALAGGSAYNDRRRSCEIAVELLKPVVTHPITALRDVSLDDLQTYKSVLPEIIYRRCRHVVSEDARVLTMTEMLKAGDLDGAGQVMNQSHVSMRDDYEISCREMDILVAEAQKLKAVYGSRMTGGGFGGSSVSLVEADKADEVREQLSQAYFAKTGLKAQIFIGTPAAGAGVLHQPGREGEK